MPGVGIRTGFARRRAAILGGFTNPIFDPPAGPPVPVLPESGSFSASTTALDGAVVGTMRAANHDAAMPTYTLTPAVPGILISPAGTLYVSNSGSLAAGNYPSVARSENASGFDTTDISIIVALMTGVLLDFPAQFSGFQDEAVGSVLGLILAIEGAREDDLSGTFDSFQNSPVETVMGSVT